MRHVLLSSLGLSPAVVTETLWAMMNPPEGQKAVVCDVVHVVTTAQRDEDWTGPPAAKEALQALADELKEGEAEPGYTLFAARHRQLLERITTLYETLGHTPPELVFECVRKANGELLADIATAEDNIRFAEHLMRTVLRYVRRPDSKEADESELDEDLERLATRGGDDPDTIVHMSLAGGRKSMSSNAQAAMSFFGRVQDRLSHVLVRPERYERDPQFWWPGSNGVGRDAEVDLVPVPFIPLQLRLSRGLRAEDVSFRGIERAGTYEMTDRLQGPAPIVIEVSSRTVTCRDCRITLRREAMEALALLAVARLENWEVEGGDDLGAGWLASRYDADSRVYARARRTADAIHRELLWAEGKDTGVSSAEPIVGTRTDAERSSFFDMDGRASGFGPPLNGLLGDLRREELYLANRLRIERHNIPGTPRRTVWRLALPPNEIVLLSGRATD